MKGGQRVDNCIYTVTSTWAFILFSVLRYTLKIFIVKKSAKGIAGDHCLRQFSSFA